MPGLNDAGIETFEGDFARNVVRECAQNSLDAAESHDEPVNVEINLVLLDPKKIPFFAELRKVLQACGDYWSHYEKARKFFDSAVRLTRSNHVVALKVSDYGTTGVDGSDDDISSRWFGLVKSRGVSNQKEAGSGGSYGIGKDAPLALSAFRTVIYSTRTTKGDVAVQGVCRLVTHEGTDGELTQGTGFIGQFDPKEQAYRALRKTAQIPEQFLREEPGLDVWILGSRHLQEGWAQPFIRSALANFWPAINGGKIVFTIGKDRIDKSNLGRWMERERHDAEVAAARPYYMSVVSQHAKAFNAALPTAGQSSLHLLLAMDDLPKKVCLVRRTGMVIDFYSPRVGFMPFSGLYVCEDTEGNRLLKSLEPPRHDKWDPARAEDRRAALALDEIKSWIREKVKEQIPHIGEDQFNESEVPPDLLETEPENPLAEDTANDPETDLGGSPTVVELAVSARIKARRAQRKRGAGDKGGGGLGDDVEDPKGGDGEKTGGRKNRTGAEVGDADLSPKHPNVITRAFSDSNVGDVYELILRSDGDYDGSIYLEGVGDDGSADQLALESAELIGGGSLEVERAKISKVILNDKDAVRLRVRLKQPGKYSLKVSL